MFIHFTPMDLSSSYSNLFNNIECFTEVEKVYENEFDVLGSIQHHIIHNQKWERYQIPITRERILPLIFLILSSVSFYLICVALPLNFFHRRKTINGFGNRRLAISGQCSEDSGGFGEDENDKGEGNEGADAGDGDAGYSESNNDDNEGKSDDDNDDDCRGKRKQKKRKDYGADYRRFVAKESRKRLSLWEQDKRSTAKECEISALEKLDTVYRRYKTKLETINRLSRFTRIATGMRQNFSETHKKKKEKLKEKMNEDRRAVLSDLERDLNGENSFVFKMYKSVPGFEKFYKIRAQMQEESRMRLQNQTNQRQQHPAQNDQFQWHPGQNDPWQTDPGQNDQSQWQPGPGQNDQFQWHTGHNDPWQQDPGQNDQSQWHADQNDQSQWQPVQDDQSQSQPGQNDQSQSQPGPGQNDQFQWHTGHNDPWQQDPGQNDQSQWHADQTDESQWHPGQNNQSQWQPGQNNQFQWQPGQNDQSQWHPCQNDKFQWQPGQNDQFRWQPGQNDQSQLHPGQNDQSQWHPGQKDPWQPHPVQYDQLNWHPGQDSAWQLGENNPYDQQDQFRYQPYSESNNDGNERQSNDDNDGDCRGEAQERKGTNRGPDYRKIALREYRERARLWEENALKFATPLELVARRILWTLSKDYHRDMEIINRSTRKTRKQAGMLKAFPDEDKAQKRELKEKLKKDQLKVLDDLEVALGGRFSFLFTKYKSIYRSRELDSLMEEENQNYLWQPDQQRQDHQWQQQTISDQPVSQVHGYDQSIMQGGSHDDSLAEPEDYSFDINDYIPPIPTDTETMPLSAYPPLQEQSLDEFKPYTQEKQQDNSEVEQGHIGPDFWFFPTETVIGPLQPSTSQLAGQQYWLPPSTAQQKTLDNGQSRHHSQETQSQQKQRTHMEGEGQSQGKAIHGDESPFGSSMRISEPVFHLPEQQQQQTQIQLGAYQSQQSQRQIGLPHSSISQWPYTDSTQQTQNDQALQSNLFPLMPLHQAQQGQQSMPVQQGLPEVEAVSDIALIDEIIKELENE